MKERKTECICPFTVSGESEQGNAFKMFRDYNFKIQTSSISFGSVWSDVLTIKTDYAIGRCCCFGVTLHVSFLPILISLIYSQEVPFILCLGNTRVRNVKFTAVYKISNGSHLLAY